jgi:hypothetical protein
MACGNHDVFGFEEETQVLIAGRYRLRDAIRRGANINVPRTALGRRSRRKPRPDTQARCSFCGHAESEERRLVAGPDVWICADCVALCGEILAQPADARSK